MLDRGQFLRGTSRDPIDAMSHTWRVLFLCVLDDTHCLRASFSRTWYTRNRRMHSSLWSPLSACRVARFSGVAEDFSQCFIFAMPQTRLFTLKYPTIRLASSNSASEGIVESRRVTIERVDNDERCKHLNRTPLAIKMSTCNRSGV